MSADSETTTYSDACQRAKTTFYFDQETGTALASLDTWFRADLSKLVPTVPLFSMEAVKICSLFEIAT